MLTMTPFSKLKMYIKKTKRMYFMPLIIDIGKFLGNVEFFSVLLCISIISYHDHAFLKK